MSKNRDPISEPGSSGNLASLGFNLGNAPDESKVAPTPLVSPKLDISVSERIIPLTITAERCETSASKHLEPHSAFFGGRRCMPLVGWLVCIDGPDIGMDYRLYSDMNSIGIVKGDTVVSSMPNNDPDIRAIISYDPENFRYSISISPKNTQIVRLNDRIVLREEELHNYDIIRIGNTRLLFFGLCGEQFEWERDATFKDTPPRPPLSVLTCGDAHRPKVSPTVLEDLSETEPDPKMLDYLWKIRLYGKALNTYIVRVDLPDGPVTLRLSGWQNGNPIIRCLREHNLVTGTCIIDDWPSAGEEYGGDHHYVYTCIGELGSGVYHLRETIYSSGRVGAFSIFGCPENGGPESD